MNRAEMIRRQRACTMPEAWKPQFIVAILPRHLAEICTMWSEIPGPGASEAELADTAEWIRTAIHCGATGFFRAGRTAE